MLSYDLKEVLIKITKIFSILFNLMKKLDEKTIITLVL